MLNPEFEKMLENARAGDLTAVVKVGNAPSVQSIGYSAFENCIELESVVIPASVANIEFHCYPAYGIAMLQ